MRKYQNQKWSVLKNQRGATAIIVGASMFALVGFAALVVDLGNLHVARNELQNAADAGALAGARKLYNNTGTAINCVDDDSISAESANSFAYSVAKANLSQNESVDVNWTSGTNNNDDDVQRGHWSFANKSFTPNASSALTDLWNVSFNELDADPNFINAVRVVARRQATPVASFFAKIFGYNNFEVEAEAVAYIGFAKTINEKELDLPLTLCIDSILVGNEYSCNIGRVINNGNDPTTSETGRWTNFASVPDSDPTEDPNVCDKQEDSVSSDDFKDMLICDGGLNPDIIYGGDELSTNNGAMTVLSIIHDCFVEKSNKTIPWKVTLPVIDCNGGPTCGIVKGAVTVTIVWITEDKNYADAPIEMEGMRDSEGNYVLGDDSKALYEDWGAPSDITTVDSGGEDSLYEFMKTLDDYSGVEAWDKELTKEFSDPLNDPPSYEWYELPLADFFEVEGMSLGETKAAGKVRWASFIRHFNLKNVIITEGGDEVTKPAPFAKESIYFLPDCSGHELAGRTGGENFGVLAKIPALVH